MSKELVLSKYRDPYTEWGPVHQKRAEWASELFNRMYRRTHLRGFHYWLTTQTVTKPDNTPYQNTEADWGYLQTACLEARYMGIGNWSGLIDRKHPSAFDYAENPDLFLTGPGELYQDGVKVQEFINNRLAELADQLIEEVLEASPSYSSEGYQQYYLVVYCEKNTMNEILQPICERYKAAFQPLIGECSMERVLDHVRRAHKSQKPVRVFYISDFDPSGKQMPVSVSRKFEYFAREVFKFNFDIKLQPIALTYDQVIQYQLPGIPTKDSDSRAAAFVSKYGDRATELDALEALHPGQLAALVSSYLEPYFNSEAIETISETNSHLYSVVRDMVEPIREQLRQALSGLIIDGIDGLDTSEALQNCDFYLPNPESGLVDDSLNEWLLDTNRNYDEQLLKYRAWKEKK